MSKYLFNLESKYTFFKLGYICSFKSKYSWKVYEFLHSWLAGGRIMLTVQNALLKLGLGQYDTYSEFRKRILQPAITEINMNTDIMVKFGLKKKNGKVTNILFVIQQKSEEELSELEKNFNEDCLDSMFIEEMFKEFQNIYSVS